MARSILFAADGTPAASRALGLLEGYRGDAAAIDVVVLNVQTAAAHAAMPVILAK